MKSVKTFVFVFVLGVAGAVYGNGDSQRVMHSCGVNMADCCVAGASCCTGDVCCSVHKAE
jgi:hypothetical protein